MKPFDHNKFLGYVSEITPTYVRMQIPTSNLLRSFYYKGEIYEGGIVGSFVVIEGPEYGFLGRIIDMCLPQGERVEITENKILESDTEFHPMAKIELLGLFDVFNPSLLQKTVSRFPRIGAKVYACSDEQMENYIEKFGEKNGDSNVPYAPIGILTSNNSICRVSLNSLFGRHCAVLGTTGGGKSWTVATLLESISNYTSNKCILIDATGEYGSISDEMESISMGEGTYIFPYQKLSIDELYFLLRPSSKTQVPKLMEAIRSLKMVRLNSQSKENKLPNITNDILVKAGQEKRPYQEFYFRHIAEIEDKNCDFDFGKLAPQITQECVWDCDRNDSNKWGGKIDNDVANCVSLISRINNIINTDEYNRIFCFKGQQQGQESIIEKLESFLASEEKQVFRIDFSNVSFDYQVREILVNSLGKYLLEKARKGDFKLSPLIVFIDEAHQFLNKSVSDEYFANKPLDSFEQISKESRKYGLFVCIATQMPRDIPLGTLSQMGTFIVHRLINEQDKKAVENAASAANRNILSFLPVLGGGEAVLVGVDFPMPLTVKIKAPYKKPNSATPQLSIKKTTTNK